MSRPVTVADFERIAAEISSDDSPVGIDAKKTHVMILAKLESLERLAGGASPAGSTHGG